jgi:hypothetical protein
MAMKNRFGAIVYVAAAALSAQTEAQAPKGSYYVNPLSIEDTRSIADPAAIRFKGKYYLFLSGGMVWSSDDLAHWTHHPVTIPGRRGISAPNIFQYKDRLYLTGNDTGLYRSADPLGPWEYLGDIHDASGKKMLLFDSMGFVDDDGRAYMYYSGRHSDGIWGVELNPKDLTAFLGEPKRFWSFDKSHIWERYGDNHEGAELSWIEAPWMTKHNGTYYLQYSAPGTEWKTYAVGVYTSKHPLGPFTYAPRNPILIQKDGLINGTGHHTVIEGPDGNLYAIYTILYRNWGVFDRRIGLDRVEFDKASNMFVTGPSETPQLVPGLKAANPVLPIAVSINRYSWTATSAAPGRDPSYAFDNNIRTWWQPAENDSAPSLTLDLGCRNPTDANQEFLVNSTRLLFEIAPPDRTNLTVDGHSPWYPNAPRVAPPAYQYRIETSLDNREFTTALDRTANTRANNVEFGEFAPVRCRWIRLAITGRPKDTPLAVLEFTAFGQPVETESAK